MSNLPLISIITVTFHAEKYLEKTIQSIRNQTYDQIEYLVIDGHSKDNTVQIIKNNTDIITHWISEPDHGLYDAMNKGLSMATGDYVWFMNAGDEIYDEHTLSSIFQEDKDWSDVYYGQTMVIDKVGREIGLRRLKPGDSLTWKSFKWGQLVSHQAFIAKLKLTPLYDTAFRYSADTDWQIKILKKASKIKDTGLILCKFLEGGRSKQTILPSLKERLKIMRKNYGLLMTILVHLAMIPRFLVFYIRHKRF